MLFGREKSFGEIQLDLYLLEIVLELFPSNREVTQQITESFGVPIKRR